MTHAEQKRLLALDGGGIMGLISLAILQKMEDQLREAHGGGDDFRLRDFFDYIAGTSTGAIIAAGLMTGMKVSELTELYEQRGKEMFAPALRWGKLRKGRHWLMSGHKFLHANLEALLKEKLGEGTTLEMQRDGRLPTDKHLMMVMHNVNTDSPWYVATNPAARYNSPDHPQCNLNIPLWQLVRASTAAPGYFFPEVIVLGSGVEAKTIVFQDGGITPHNNPALKLFQMATMPAFEVSWETGAERLLLVSVGTGRLEKIIKRPKAGRNPIWKIAEAAPGWLMTGASSENDLTCRMLGHCVHGNKIDNEVGDLTGGSPEGKQFTYARYDINLTDALLKNLNISGRAKELKMDEVGQIGTFKTIGTKAAEQVDCRTQFSGFL